MKYIDMHIHLEDYSEKEIDPNIIYFANSVDIATYDKTIDKFNKFDNVNISFGIHPAYVLNCKLNKNQIEKLLPENIFIGEIGLDFFWIEDKSTYIKQLKYFEIQLKLGKKLSKIPMIHTKGAEYEVLNLLKKYSIKNPLIHWYSGPVELINEYLELGAYFTIGPDILIGNKLYKNIPLNRLFLETDNPTGFPWIVGDDYNYKNRGLDIILLYEKLSELLNIEKNDLKDIIFNNLIELKK